MLEQGQSVRSPPPEEEGSAETVCDEPTATPIPCSSVSLVGTRQRKSGVKLSPGTRKGWGEGVFKILFSHYPALI